MPASSSRSWLLLEERDEAMWVAFLRTIESDEHLISARGFVPSQPRVVEYENAVGRALATEEDPDYDVTDNKLYEGGNDRVMIRPYPLPKAAKV